MTHANNKIYMWLDEIQNHLNGLSGDDYPNWPSANRSYDIVVEIMVR